MKTILTNGGCLRVTNEVAEHEVKFRNAKYVPKSEWKKNVRDEEIRKRKEAEEAEKLKLLQKREDNKKWKAEKEQRRNKNLNQKN